MEIYQVYLIYLPELDYNPQAWTKCSKWAHCFTMLVRILHPALVLPLFHLFSSIFIFLTQCFSPSGAACANLELNSEAPQTGRWNRNGKWNRNVRAKSPWWDEEGREGRAIRIGDKERNKERKSDTGEKKTMERRRGGIKSMENMEMKKEKKWKCGKQEMFKSNLEVSQTWI